jgi:hypothetical protein
MGSVLGAAIRVFREVWAVHFRVPPVAYLTLGVVAGLLLIPFHSGQGAAALSVAVVIGIQGLARWRFHRRRRRNLALVVAVFASERNLRDTARLVQSQIVATLLDRLPDEESKRVHAIPVAVGRDQPVLAERLRWRLRAHFLLYGEIRSTDSQPAVFARVTQPAEDGVQHWDWHTRDVTPAKTTWASLVERLTPQRRLLVDEEYPLQFTTELEAMLQGTEGELAAAFEEHDKAELHLRRAVEAAGESESHQIDELRSKLGRAIFDQGREEEALELLRGRASEPTASPELLRTLDGLIVRFAAERELDDPQLQQESTSLLRRAADHRGDIRRPVTLYNLSQRLLPSAEGFSFNSELLRSRSHYQRAWYVRRTEGMRHWRDAEESFAADDMAAAVAAARRAGRYYAQAVRRRPRFRLFWRGRVFVRFERSPILYANTFDAFRLAGRRIHALRYRVKHVLARRRMIRVAQKAMRGANWSRSFAYSDWAIVGQDPPEHPELVALVWRAISRLQMGEVSAAEAEWAAVREIGGPFATWIRASVAHDERITLPRGLPGKETTDLEEIGRQQEKLIEGGSQGT